jgi:ribose 5-phosphate isomerase A
LNGLKLGIYLMRREGLRVQGVPTSVATAELAQSLDVPLVDLDQVPALDMVLDGADEVDPCFRMIKGRGGALLHEKIVAAAARQRIFVITPEKRVERLGLRHPVPVEVSAFGWKHTESRLRTLGAVTSLRRGADGQPFVTDEGNRIIDCRFVGIDDPDELNAQLRSVVGALGTGLFLGLCDLLIVGHPDHVERIERPADPSSST